MRLLSLVALAAGAVLAAAPAAPARSARPPIRHVWVVVLENKNFDEWYLPHPDYPFVAPSPYLARTLPARGALLPRYYAITHLSLGNYLGMISGQGPTPQVQADCLTFSPFVATGRGRDGQLLGSGCAYPRSTRTLPDQLRAKRLTWKGYIQDMRRPCEHPELGATDDNFVAMPGHQYATRHNPFVYFRSITDSPECAKRDVPLGALSGDLRRVSSTPNFSMVVPNLCEDGHDAVCANGDAGGLRGADRFLRRWVPRITRSPAFRRDGLLVVTWDEAQADQDSSACCGQPRFPNVTTNGGPSLAGPGGGRPGALLLSPFIRPGTRSNRAYNHFSLLRWTEDQFGLRHLGYAARRGLPTFGRDVFTRLPRRARRPG